MTGVSADDGYTLVEVLVAIAILGIAFVSLLGAFRMSILGSDAHKQQSQVEAVIDSAVEQVKSVPHVTCAVKTEPTYVNAAQSAAAANPPGWALSTVQITDIQYWDPSSATGWNSTTCFDKPENNFLNLQLITLKVTNPGTRADQTLSFVKR